MHWYYIIKCVIDGTVHSITANENEFSKLYDFRVGDWRNYTAEKLIEQGISGTVTEMTVSRSHIPNHPIHRSKKQFILKVKSNPSLDDANTVELTENFHKITLVKVISESTYAIPSTLNVEEAIAKLKAGTMIGHEVGGTRKVIDVVKLKTISKG